MQIADPAHATRPPPSDRSRTTIVPSYSAGLPMLMAFAKLIGGQRAIFWVVPLCGGVFVLATFGIGRRLAGSYGGLVAAWLLATSPPFLFMLMAPMSDVPQPQRGRSRSGA